MSVILGIGTNLGDRLSNLRLAVKKIAECNITIDAISPIYISDALLPENAPDAWNLPYLNIAIQCQTSLEPLALLETLQQLEQSCGRSNDHAHWEPRIIDIDILAWDERVIADDKLTIPHKQLLKRPFALWPLADIAPFWIYASKDTENNQQTAAQLVEAWGSRFSGEAPFHTRQLAQRMDGARLVGILNITPDSFSDGGSYLKKDAALQQALKLVEDGAEIIDIGAESSSPKAMPLTWQEEWQRLEPALSAVQAAKEKFLLTPIISIDTRHAETAKRALDYGVDWINDVSGFDSVEMRAAVLHSEAKLVVMHHLSIPERRDHLLPRSADPVPLIIEWGQKRIDELVTAGIKKDRIIFDPGIGFGKMAEQSLAILKRIKEFEVLGVDIFVGHSRKTFLSLLTGTPAIDRDVETAVCSLFLSQHGVRYLRVHNVAINSKVLKSALMV